MGELIVRAIDGEEAQTAFPHFPIKSEAKGFLLELDGKPVGKVGYTLFANQFYAHDLYVMDESVRFGAAKLIQAVRKQGQSLGYDEIYFDIFPHQPALFELVKSGTLQIEFMRVKGKT